MGIWYCTREQVKSALDLDETARVDAQVDRLIDASCRSVEALCHRRFYPELTTRYFAWPNDQMGRSWRLWLDKDELISVTSILSGTTTITAYFLEPQRSGPPYSRVETDLSSSAAFSAGSTHQRAVAITGLYGYDNSTAPAGTLTAAITTTAATTATVTDSAKVGVGDLLTVDTERMTVTAKTMVTTGQTLLAPVTASKADVALAVTTGTAYAVGETLLLDSERMLIVDIAGNTLTVRRAHDGSVLAAHTAPIIYAPRTLTVVRGVLGTTAATHLTAATVSRQVYPGPVVSLAIAETVWRLQNEQSGMARVIGTGETARQVSASAIHAAREDVYTSHGRKVRSRAV